MTIPQNILAQFEELNPRAAALLSLADTSGVRLVITNGSENILDERGHEPYYFHHPECAEKEAVHWWSSIEMTRIECLVIFGIGAGWHWKALIPWLQRKSERRVIILEDDIAVLSHFLHTEIAQLFFQDSQSTLLYLEDGEEGKKTLEMLAWNLYQKKYKVVASPSYLERRVPFFLNLRKEITTEENNLKSVLDEFFTFGEGQLRNFGRNIFFWQKSLQGNSLFNQFRGCPAIVVAAGPSLDKDMDLLRKANSSALILAGGSSIGALLQGGVTPHLTATVDPNYAQYSRLRAVMPYCLPLFYRSRALFEGLFSHRGPFIYLKGGDGYPIVDYFEKTLGVTGKTTDGGESVSNLLVELAVALGCNPVIMVGYDLAYTNGARYSKHVSESLQKGEKVSFEGVSRGEIVEGVSQNGSPITTEVKWVTEARWIEKFCQDYPNIKFLNTAEHGLKISGVQCTSLSDAVATYCPPTRDIEGLVHLTLQEASKMPFPINTLARTIYQLSHSMEKIEQLLNEIIEHSKGLDIPEEDPCVVELLQKVEQEEAFKEVLLPFFLMHRKLSFMRALLEVRPFGSEETRQKYETKAFLDRCSFLMQACDAHQRFFFSVVSWGATIGVPLPKGISLAPIPKEFTTIPEGVIQ